MDRSRRPLHRPARRGPFGTLLVLGLAFLMAALAQPAAFAHPSRAAAGPLADWHGYVETPTRADVCATSVVSASGAVNGAEGLLCGGRGRATLTLTPGGTPPVLVLDYGQEVGGVPFFSVAAESGSPTLGVAYSEGAQYVGPSGDVTAPWADGDPSRADSYQVTGPGTITNRYVQGGERYERLTLTSPGTLTLSATGVHYIADRTQAADYAGYFLSSSDELNRIWYSGAYTLQADSVPAHTLPGSWTAGGGGLDAGGSTINGGAGVLDQGTSWGDYTSTFRARVLHNQAGWLVRARSAQDGYLFILDDSSDTVGAPDTLQELDVHDGDYTLLGSVALPSPLAEGSAHTVATTVAGGTISVSLDGVPVASVDTGSLPDGAVAYPTGTVGFREYDGEEAQFSDLSVVGTSGTRLFGDALTSASSISRFTPPGSNVLPSVLDGARRDRAIWSGDLNTEGLTDFYSIDDPAYIKDSLLLLGSHQLSSGFVTGALHPATVPRIGPPIPGTTGLYSATYSMYFVTALASYYLYTGDTAFVRQEWPIVQRELDWNARQVDADGLFATTAGVDGADWDFYDGDKGGEVSAYNMIYYKTLLDGAALATAAGETGAAADCSARAVALRTAINSRLFDSATGLYRISDTETTGTAQDANALAVLYGVAPAARTAGILAALKSALWTTPYGPLPFSADTGNRDLVSPFVSGFELQARLAAGDTGNAQALLDTEWGHMIAPGADATGTLWENVSGADGTPGLGSQTSLAHGWSTAPTSALSAYVLGVRPDTAGYRTWTVQPQPGSLGWAEGRIPTPHGPITVRWSRSHGRFTLTVTVPRGTSGTVTVPVTGAVTVDGKKAATGGASGPHGVTAVHSGPSGVTVAVDRAGTYTVAVTAAR